MARPPKEIDEKIVELMASWGCKTTEIADHFNVSVDTIDRRFADILVKSRADLKTSLRQWQLAAAKKGNITMLIWLGKQMLGQTDKQEILNEDGKGFEIIVKDYVKKKPADGS